MAYRNYSYSGGQPYGGYGNSQRAPYRTSYNRYGGSNMRSYYGVQRSPRKRSGAKFQMNEGAPIISAWRVSKGQMFSLYARPYKNTHKTESKNGKDWMNLFVTITNKTTMQTQNTSGLYDVSSKRLYIKDFNLIVTNKGQGGYFGKHISSSYNRR